MPCFGFDYATCGNTLTYAPYLVVAPGVTQAAGGCYVFALCEHENPSTQRPDRLLGRLRFGYWYQVVSWLQRRGALAERKVHRNRAMYGKQTGSAPMRTSSTPTQLSPSAGQRPPKTYPEAEYTVQKSEGLSAAASGVPRLVGCKHPSLPLCAHGYIVTLS